MAHGMGAILVLRPRNMLLEHRVAYWPEHACMIHSPSVGNMPTNHAHAAQSISCVHEGPRGPRRGAGPDLTASDYSTSLCFLCLHLAAYPLWVILCCLGGSGGGYKLSKETFISEGT